MVRGVAIRCRDAFRRDRRGVTTIEYALIGAFIFLAIVVALAQLGTRLAAPFATLSSAL